MTVNVTDTVGANNTIVLDGNSKIPAIDGSQVTALSATAFTTGTLATARIDVGTTAGKVLQLDGSARIPALSGANLTNVPGPTSSTSDPAVDTNPTLGAKWINKTSGEIYICTDATTDENVWTNVGAGSGDIVPYVFQGESDGYSAGGARDSGLKITKFSFASNTTATVHGDLTTGNSNDGSRPGMSSPTHGFLTDSGVTGLQKFAFAGSSVSGSSHGDLAERMDSGAMASNNETHGFVCGGYGTSNQTDAINKFAFSSNTTAADHGNLTSAKFDGAGQSSETHGYASGGHKDGGPGSQDTIYKYAFSSNTTATDIGNLTGARRSTASNSSATYGYTTGGKWPANYSTVIDKFPFASDTNAADVGDLSVGRQYCGGHSSTTHGFTSNGDSSGAGYSNVIDKFSFSSDGNATDHGDGYWAAGTGNINMSSHQV